MTDEKPKPQPKPRAPKAPSPVQLAAAKHHPVKVPVVADIPAEELAAAAKHGSVLDGQVVVKVGRTTHAVGPAEGDDPIAPYVRRYFEHVADLERFHGKLEVSEPSIREIDEALASLAAVTDSPDSVGDLAAFAERRAPIIERATAIKDRVSAERAAAREAAQGVRENIVARAEEIASRIESAVQWKADTAALRGLLDEWKAAQKDGAKIAREAEKELWARFSHARTAFEKARKHHFAELDKVNDDVKAAKEALVAKAEALVASKDWDGTARAYRDLMAAWKNAGRGRRSTDDALWARFKAAQDAFFESRRETTEAETAVLTANVGAKEAAVVDAEGILPVRDLAAAKAALRAARDRYDKAGDVPKPDEVRLSRRIAAVERAIRDAEQAQWDASNPELEARANAATEQLVSAIADLDAQIASAEKAGDAREVARLTEARTAREAWLDQIRASVS